MHIMVVDDEEYARMGLVDEIMKVEPDSEVLGFSSPKLALQHARKHPVEVAFLDIEMPFMSGVELAQKLIEDHPQINIIFVTAYQDYYKEAFSLYASGYVLKPARAEALQREFAHLRYPVQQLTEPQEEEASMVAVTFGCFEVFVDGKPLHFKRAKAKEALAYLIDRKGTTVTKRELASILFEDKAYTKKVQDYVNKILQEMESTLRDAGVYEVYKKNRNAYAIVPERISCDYFRYLKGDPSARQAFGGAYMTQFSWAEVTLGELCD